MLSPLFGVEALAREQKGFARREPRARDRIVRSGRPRAFEDRARTARPNREEHPRATPADRSAA